MPKTNNPGPLIRSNLVAIAPIIRDPWSGENAALVNLVFANLDGPTLFIDWSSVIFDPKLWMVELEKR